MSRYYMGIDIGTFESRGMLIDEHYQIAADCSARHTMENPRPGWFEHDAEKIWWGEFCSLSRSLIREVEEQGYFLDSEQYFMTEI